MGKRSRRDTIKKDMLFFALPAALVYCPGLMASAWDLVRQESQ